MDLPTELDVYIKDSIDYSLGLPVPGRAPDSKFCASEELQSGLQDEYSLLLSRLKEKDRAIELARAEACLNARALKKFVDENQKLAEECADLVLECNRLEEECFLYYNDREAVADVANEAHQRASEAEKRVDELEEEVLWCKRQLDSCKDDGTATNKVVEENLLESVLDMLVGKDGYVSAQSFLETYSAHKSFRKLLKMGTCLRPTTKKVLSLAAQVDRLKKDEEHLQINLQRAEEEVKLLFEENNSLSEENKRLLRFYNKVVGSSRESVGSASAKSNKRKASRSSPGEKKTDLNDVDSAGGVLVTLESNSFEPDSMVQK